MGKYIIGYAPMSSNLGPVVLIKDGEAIHLCDIKGYMIKDYFTGDVNLHSIFYTAVKRSNNTHIMGYGYIMNEFENIDLNLLLSKDPVLVEMALNYAYADKNSKWNSRESSKKESKWKTYFSNWGWKR